MSRPIDADALKTTLGINAEYCDKCRWGDIRGRCSRSGDFEIACCAIDEAPTIDPVKHGRWVADGEYDDLWSCSECGYEFAIEGADMPSYFYCPNCGAKME